MKERVFVVRVDAIITQDITHIQLQLIVREPQQETALVEKM